MSIEERLRQAPCKDGFAIILHQYLIEAAGEIEWLRTKIRRLEFQLDIAVKWNQH